MVPRSISTPRPKKKLALPLAIFGIVIVLVLLLIASAMSRLHHAAPPPRTVSSRLGDLKVTVSETGTIAPDDQVDVKSKVAGRILTAPFDEGQFVHKGQLIATVDTSQIDPQVASTQAQLTEAEARLQQSIASYDLQVAQTTNAIAQAQAGLETAMAHSATVKAGSRPQEISQQQDAVDRAKIDLADSIRTQTRKQELLTKGFISQSEADTADVAVDTARSTLQSAQDQLTLLKIGPREEDINEAQMQVNTAKLQLDAANVNVLQNSIRKSDIDQAQSSVDQIKNQLDQLMVQLSDTRIVAPGSGIVLKKYREVGELVQSATTGFSDTDSLIVTLGSEPLVRVNINEIDIPKIDIGDPVDVTVDALPNETFKGRVASIAPVSTNSLNGQNQQNSSSVSEFPVSVQFLKPDHRLRPGMNVTVTIITSERKNAVIAPIEALSFNGNSDTGTVTILQPDGKQVKQPVKVGLRNDTDAVILSGLTPGKNLIPKPIDASDRKKLDFSSDD